MKRYNNPKKKKNSRQIDELEEIEELIIKRI
jgi:hypothetical protein